jgi:hypothetical protein
MISLLREDFRNRFQILESIRSLADSQAAKPLTEEECAVPTFLRNIMSVRGSG